MQSKKRSADTNVPANTEIERALLGAVLLDNTLMDEALSSVSTNDMYLDAHREIYSAMIRLWGDEKPIDAMTVAESLMSRKVMDRVGGLTYLSGLIDGVPKQSSLAYYISIILEKSRARTVLAQADRLRSIMMENPDGDSIDSALADFRRLTEDLGKADDGFFSLGSYGDHYMAVLAYQREHPEEIPGYTNGIKAVDDVTGGMRPGEVTVIGARTGFGKSSWALGCSIKNARAGIRVGYRSDEMKGESFFGRTLSALSMVNGFKLRNPKYINTVEMNDIRAAAAETNNLPIFIDDKPGLHIDQILARAREHVRRDGIQLYVFDFIQRIKASGDSPRERVGYAMRAIADFSRSQNVATMVLSQITRPPDKKVKNPYPSMEDLKESGEIEENANAIILLWRSSEVKTPKEGRPGEYITQKQGSDLAIIAKQRDGPANLEIPVLFQPSTLTYEQYTEREEKNG